MAKLKTDVLSYDKPWNCVGCGACCFNVSRFGLEEKEDGSCVNLNDDMSCNIYEDRPSICRQDASTPDYLLISICKKLDRDINNNK